MIEKKISMKSKDEASFHNFLVSQYFVPVVVHSNIFSVFSLLMSPVIEHYFSKILCYQKFPVKILCHGAATLRYLPKIFRKNVEFRKTGCCSNGAI